MLTALSAGLPEDVRIRQEVLRQGFAIVAISSADRRGRRCWDVKLEPKASMDGQHVAKILGTVRKREGLQQAPLYALGASSGGAFVLMLPHLVPDVQASGIPSLSCAGAGSLSVHLLLLQT